MKISLRRRSCDTFWLNLLQGMASPEEMAKLAFEVKQKTSDLQAFMRDLDNWTADIEKKDNQLRRAKGAVVQDETKSSSKRKIVPKPPEEPTKQPKEQKIRSHEYDRCVKKSER